MSNTTITVSQIVALTSITALIVMGVVILNHTNPEPTYQKQTETEAKFSSPFYTCSGGPLLVSILSNGSNTRDSIYISTDTDYIFAYPATVTGFTDALKLVSILSFPVIDGYEFESRVKALHDMHYHTAVRHHIRHHVRDK